MRQEGPGACHSAEHPSFIHKRTAKGKKQTGTREECFDIKWAQLRNRKGRRQGKGELRGSLESILWGGDPRRSGKG